MISESFWNDMIIPGIGDIEFDWFGIDKNGYLAVFSTFNSGYIPNLVKTSRIEYIKLLTKIENLPFRFKPQLITKEKGQFDDWLEYSKQGLISFDYLDIHRIIKTEIFDLISKPEKMITVSELGISDDLINTIPKFKLSFNENKGISEKELRENIA